MPKFKNIDENQLLNLYNLHHNVKEIERITGYDDATIYRRLKYIGVNTERILFKCNENYFEVIDTTDKAYFLGLLVADGSNNGSGFVINLQEGDVEILKLFKKYINYTGNITYNNLKNRPNPYGYNRQNQYCLKILSHKISKDLDNLYCVENKTFFTQFPPIPQHFQSHFIRGVFDGDGSICIHQQKIKDKYYQNYLFNITGYIPFLKQIRDILVENEVVKKNKINMPKRNKFTGRSEDIGMLQYSGSINSVKFREYIYKDCGDLFLTRKKEKFDSIIPKQKFSY